jgi:hypothetical protein
MIDPRADDGRPRCRCCRRPLHAPTSRALLIGPECLTRLPASDRHRLVLAAVRATRQVPVQPDLDAA